MKKNFSVSAHFIEGLLKADNGDGKNIEILVINPPRFVMISSLVSLALHYIKPISIGLAKSIPFFPYRILLSAFCFFLFLTGVKQCVNVLVEKGSSPHHTEATTALVTSGPYSFSRNPAYIVIQLIPIGFAIASDSFWPIIFGIPVIYIYLDRIVIPKEEELLKKLFPDEWKKYISNVRRWI